MPTNPGIHPKVFPQQELSLPERQTTYALSRCFYVTGCSTITLGPSTYRYLIVKAADNLRHALPSEREIIFLFSPYPTFEARTLDAYFHVIQKYEDHRLNPHFRFLCSMDEDIRAKLQKICVEEPDIPVTIPLLYGQLTDTNVVSQIVSAARQSYHFRDLFAQRTPLKNDTYFFGRDTVLSSVRDRMTRGENSGIFGLRKSGKTSLLLAAARAAKTDGHRLALVDCQNPSVSRRNWNDVLRSAVRDLRTQAGLSTTDSGLGDFSEDQAAESFEKNILQLYSRNKAISIVAFDEIEHLSPGSGSTNWKDGTSSLLIWQTIRSVQQRFPGRVAFIVAGTNPTITESRQIAGVDNPLLEYVHNDFLGGLTDREVQNMCSTIGALMGMEFTVEAAALLYSKLGGHPFLTRQICSHIHKSLPYDSRPIEVDHEIVKSSIEQFDFSSLLDDMLFSLKDRYPDEYDCLQWVALGDQEQIGYFLKHDPRFLSHLEGYGILSVDGERVSPKMGMAIDYIRGRARTSSLVKKQPDRWAYIASRRGLIERDLRFILRNRLIECFGKADAAENLREILTNERAKQIAHCGLDEIFAESDCKLYWSDIMMAIRDDVEYWCERLGMKREELLGQLDFINKFRNDAHARPISDGDFDSLQKSFDALREAI